jgi:hypothetical protein
VFSECPSPVYGEEPVLGRRQHLKTAKPRRDWASAGFSESERVFLSRCIWWRGSELNPRPHSKPISTALALRTLFELIGQVGRHPVTFGECLEQAFWSSTQNQRQHDSAHHAMQPHAQARIGTSHWVNTECARGTNSMRCHSECKPPLPPCTHPQYVEHKSA